MDEIVIRWILIAAIFLAGEILVRTYYLLGFASGALVGSIAADFDVPFIVQWLLFFFVSIIIIIFAREIKKEAN